MLYSKDNTKQAHGTQKLSKRQPIHMATIQETKIRPQNSTPKFTGYTTLRHDRTTRGGLAS